MDKYLNGVLREVKNIARHCNKELNGVIAVKIDASGVYACKEDWVYRKVSIPIEKLIFELQKANLPVNEVSCLIDDEYPESYCIQNRTLQFYELKL